MAAVNLMGSYNYALVALSVMIAIFASYAALDLTGRVTAARGWTQAAWLLGGAGAMGTGIWSMHYIGMLAFILPIPVAYHWPTVLLSLLAAILASAVALGVASRQKMGALRALAGSVLMGAGISSMHYIGMAAMRLPAMCQYNSFLVVLSVVFAVLISLAALWITFHFRDEKTRIGREKLAGAVVMGAAIPVMHYTGMAAVSFTASGMPVDLTNAVSLSTLGPAGIAAVTFIVLGLALLTSWMDRRFAAQTLELQEQKLQRAMAYLAEAEMLSHTGSFGWKVSAGEIIWSEESFRIFQYDRTTIPTVGAILHRVHPKDVALVKQTIERASQDGNNFEHEYRLLMPDGSIKYVHVVARAFRDKSGSLEFVGAVMDVTAAKLAEKTLRESEAYLAEAQRFSHTGSWAVAPESEEIRYWSEECYRVLGFDPHEGLPRLKTYFQRIHLDDVAMYIEQSERAAREKTGFEFDFRIVHPSGEIRDIHTIAHPVFSPSGDLIEFVGTVIDVTERKRADEERERLRKSLADLAHINRVTTMGELTASLAHEIRQPIAATVTSAQTCLRWLRRDQPDVAEACEAASRILKDVTRAAEIISRISSLFKKGAPQRELVDVNELIGEMIALLRNEAARYSISFRSDLVENLPRVMADRIQLQQVFMNLMLNGIDAMKETISIGELSIKSEACDTQLLISVSDTGVGLPPEQANKIFNAFFTTKDNGTGMGLPISRSIIESHGGRLWAAANSPCGASFCFTLPTKAETLE